MSATLSRKERRAQAENLKTTLQKGWELEIRKQILAGVPYKEAVKTVCQEAAQERKKTPTQAGQLLEIWTNFEAQIKSFSLFS